ncbi:MAG: DUF896 domain-containing protein [Oscillospiraceae bacterium]|nr:DUF896 domain-containing protein [Oscillospiraceae bacterium]
MEQFKIDRINELARTAKERSLTAGEKAEQQLLRKEYIEAFRKSTVAALEHTYIQYPDGHKEKLKRKK